MTLDKDAAVVAAAAASTSAASEAEARAIAMAAAAPADGVWVRVVTRTPPFPRLIHQRSVAPWCYIARLLCSRFP